MIVGTIVELLVACLGNPAGTKGVVYEQYNLGDGPAVSVIFKNGDYDGFSPDEQKSFLKEVGITHDPDVANYKFKNVMILSRDFSAGKFKSVFSRSW